MNGVLAVVAACAACGTAGGILYEPVCLVKKFCGRAALIAADIVFFALFGCLFVAVSALFCFPGLRLYMFAAVAGGFILYQKSLHRILAFLAEKLYNRYRSGRRAKRTKPRRPSVHDERGKI